MTNIKARGFESPSHLREHLDELEQESPAEDPSVAEAVLSPAEEIAELRGVVAELHARLAAIREQTDGIDAPRSRGDLHPWLRIVVTAATAFVLARLVQEFRLGAPGAAAVPLLTAQLDRRLW